MSAFFVLPGTIDLSVTLIMNHEREPQSATALGRQLWDMNRSALCQRYGMGNDEIDDMGEDINAYDYHGGYDASPVAIVKAANCVEYQCSEGDVPTWDLYKRLTTARDSLCNALGGYDRVTGMHEYNALPWDFPRPGADVQLVNVEVTPIEAPKETGPAEPEPPVNAAPAKPVVAPREIQF